VADETVRGMEQLERGLPGEFASYRDKAMHNLWFTTVCGGLIQEGSCPGLSPRRSDPAVCKSEIG
jgi:hypothetical protein